MSIRTLIREFLLQEEVFGAQAFVYHGSKAPPEVLVPAIVNDEYKPGTHWRQAFYGRALYTTYKLNQTATDTGFYGGWVYKLKVNLYGFISFDPDVTKKIYKRDMTPAEQAEFIGAPTDVIKNLKEYIAPAPGRPTSDGARWAARFLRGKVKGIIFTGRHDGQVVCIYDASVVTPVAWKVTGTETWNTIDRDSIKPALAKSAMGDWQPMKYANMLPTDSPVPERLKNKPLPRK